MTGTPKPATDGIVRECYGGLHDSHRPSLSGCHCTTNCMAIRLRLEEPTAMLHFSCDICGKDLSPSKVARYVVKMEAFAATDPAELTEEDLDADHVEEMAQLLRELEESGCDEAPGTVPAGKKLRFDLCPCCYSKFLADPLGREGAAKFDFSEN